MHFFLYSRVIRGRRCYDKRTLLPFWASFVYTFCSILVGAPAVPGWFRVVGAALGAYRRRFVDAALSLAEAARVWSVRGLQLVSGVGVAFGAA